MVKEALTALQQALPPGALWTNTELFECYSYTTERVCVAPVQGRSPRRVHGWSRWTPTRREDLLQNRIEEQNISHISSVESSGFNDNDQPSASACIIGVVLWFRV